MCATSIGLTFSQIPVPGERKSGMPDGTEMPAPVSTTARSAVLRSSASSLALELRLPLPKERPDAFLRILGSEHLAEGLALAAQALAELSVHRYGLDPLDRHGRLLRQLARPRQRDVKQLVVGDHAGGQTPPQRVVGVDRL